MNDLSQKRELYEAAKDWLDNPAFDFAIQRMKDDVTGDLMIAKGAEEKLDLVAKLKMIDRLKKEFASIMRDYTEALRRGHG